uniref:Calpain catalytic domain-containing protein n=1 Tax=Anopheles dirus TaxID=7168 RepID=A0A182N3N8_9DIPT
MDGDHEQFQAIRNHYSSERALYEDPYFPPNSVSIGKTDVQGPITWKRPGELVDHPKFVTEGYSQFDAMQGYLGNCWFVSSCASLTTQPELFERVIPRDNGEFDDEKYAGMFHFRFWQDGQWKEVIIDDRLPVDKSNKLIFMRSSATNEFWAALVEKAYAKLHGSYEALAGGTGIRGMTALTGGITAYYILKGRQPHDLFEILEKYLPLRALATMLKVVRLCNVKLVCVRNPWGHVEWKGNWSDHSQKWHEVPYEERKKLHAIKDNGEFWMSFYDFNIDHSEHQDFCTLRGDCQSAGVLYEDPYFPANYYSINNTGTPRYVEGPIRWLRPREIVDHPKFVTDGYSQFDVVQGYLGDCWFASSCASLTTQPELFERVVPRDNKDFDDHRYVGLFHFYFCDGNQWVEIKIDDRLPVDQYNRLIYMKSSVQNEFWAALVEKAYAKLHGSYEALHGGSGKRVLKVVRLYNVKLVCVRNPWGHVEWKGNWSDHSQKWHEVPYEERMQLLAIKDNGEFWMSFCDFVRYFDDVTICQQTRVSIGETDVQGPITWKRPGELVDHPKFGVEPDDLFEIVEKYLPQRTLATSGIDKNEDNRSQLESIGLFYCHAYSVLRVSRLDDVKLICLRNPWGHTEWKGDWSDESSLSPNNLPSNNLSSTEHRQYPVSLQTAALNHTEDQDFCTLRSDCQSAGVLYVDPYFPANYYSINKTGVSKYVKGPIRWKRPRAIVHQPKFVTDGYSQFDVVQGSVGNCWFVSSCASLTTQPELFERVVPRDNKDFDDHRYVGLVARLYNVKLVCVRNPWGRVEWKGDWSDRSQKWHEIPYVKRKKLHAIKDNGEFWMSFYDFNHSEYQDFCTLRGDCQSAGVLYEDPYFPANYYSINKTGVSRYVQGPIAWKRPREIVHQPKFVTDGYSQFDVVQGRLGDCWFVSSCASLTTQPELFERVVPRDNKDFDDHRYVGLFHFYFCVGNQWIEIKIDDRLPKWHEIPYEERKKLHAIKDNGEFWMSFYDFVRYFDDVTLCQQPW